MKTPVLTTFMCCLLILGCGSEKKTEQESKVKPGESQNNPAVDTILEAEYNPEEMPGEENIGNDINTESYDTMNIVPVTERPELAPPYERTPTPQSFIATYKGAEFGDYYHLMFETENGYFWDFGRGTNNLGKYEYLGDVESEKAKDMIGEKYLVTWDSVWSIYPCCEGGMDPKASFMPSIVKLEPVSK